MQSWQTFLYLIPYFISMGITLGVAVYVWRRRTILGAKPLAFRALSGTLRMFFYILVLITPTLEGKLFWDVFHVIWTVVTPIASLLFALEFTDHKFSQSIQKRILIILIPFVFTLFIITDFWHGLVRINPKLFPSEYLPGLVYDYSLLLKINIIYGSGLALASIFILVRKFLKSQNLFRFQIATIVFGILIPTLGFTLTVANVIIYRQSLAIFVPLGNFVIALGLFRYRLLDIVPVAHSTVFENIPDAVIVLDSQRRLVDFNPAAQKQLPQLSADSIGLTAREMFSDIPDVVGRFHGVEEIHTEVEIEGEDGVLFQDVRIAPFRNKKGGVLGMVIVLRDITDRIQAEKDAARYAVELEAANKELEAFSYSVSHDLRAPLRAIKGFSELLADKYKDKLEKEGQENLQRVLDASRQMGSLIEDLLRLSRVSSSEMSRQKVNISELADKITRNLLGSQPDRTVNFNIDPDMFADCDPGLIRVVLENLLGNSWKFTGKQQHSKIAFGCEESVDQKTFFVRDNGVGFDMAYAEKMFAPFQRLHSSSEFEGTGIGLATVQRIIRKHGGRVWVEAKVGEGATFYFTL